MPKRVLVCRIAIDLASWLLRGGLRAPYGFKDLRPAAWVTRVTN
jgi:hypothetical protein